MSELLNASLKESCYFKFLDETFEVVMEFSISTLRFYMGFLLSDSFINCNAFLNWCVELSLAEFILNHSFRYLVNHFYPEHIKSLFFDFLFPKLLALWCVSLLFHQSLLVLLFSQVAYGLFTYYSKLFCRLLVESFTLFYYYQNPWIVFPIMVNLLLTSFYFFDTVFQTNSLGAFSHFKFFEALLKEWGIAIVDYKVNNYEANLQNNTHQLPGLTREEHYHYITLKKRYLNNKSIKEQLEHFEELKIFLADEYYAHQAFFTDKKNHVHVLPLEWSDFVKYRQKVSGHERVGMLKSYYANPYHGAWRMLSKENPWASNDVKSQANHKHLLENQHLELILTVWLALKNEHSQSKHPDLVKIKSDMFIKVLANTNRFRNLHLHRGRRELDMDDLHADKMGDIKLLLCTLLPIVAERHSDKFLTLGILKKFLDSFVKSIWIEQFMSLQKDEQQEITDIWKKISKRESFFHDYEEMSHSFKLTHQHKESFLVKMNTLYGRAWNQRKEFVATVDDYFSNHQPHLYPYLNEVASEMEFIVRHHTSFV